MEDLASIYVTVTTLSPYPTYRSTWLRVSSLWTTVDDLLDGLGSSQKLARWSLKDDFATSLYFPVIDRGARGDVQILQSVILSFIYRYVRWVYNYCLGAHFVSCRRNPRWEKKREREGERVLRARRARKCYKYRFIREYASRVGKRCAHIVTRARIQDMQIAKEL